MESQTGLAGGDLKADLVPHLCRGQGHLALPQLAARIEQMNSGRQFGPCLLFKEVARLLLLIKVSDVVLGSISHQRNCWQPALGLWELNVGAYFQEYLT